MMVPVKPPKVNLVTEHTKEIYVPLASKHNYGIVKIGEGILIDSGVISFDRAEIKINSISKNGVLIAPDENKNINIELNKTDVGLSNVDNTSDIDKPVSTAQAEALSKKLDVRQSLANTNKILYVNKDGYLDFKTEATRLKFSNNNELVSSVADNINFSSDFVLTGSEKVNVSLSDTVKQVFKSITYNPSTSELIFVRYNDSSVSITLPFNELDSQIKDNDADIISLNTRTETLEDDIKTTVTDVTINHKDGTFTFTKKDGSTLIVDTLLEKVVTNFKYDETTKELILTLEDGSVQKIPMSAFIDDYDGVDGAEITITVSGDNKISAILKNGSVDENKLTPTLSAKIKNIPTALSQLTDDVGLGNKADRSELFSGSYNDLTDKPTIPTATSQLTNDSGFITAEDVPSNIVTTDTAQTITGVKTFGDPLSWNSTAIAIAGDNPHVNVPNMTSVYSGLYIGNRIQAPNAGGIGIGKGLTFGTASSAAGSVLIGYDSSQTISTGAASYNITIGAKNTIAGTKNVIIGYDGHVSGDVSDAIQLGTGTNSSAKTLQAYEYPLLDGSTGKIPVGRLPVDDLTSTFDASYLSFTNTTQTLTEDQQALVRSKIGAGSGSFSGDYNDLINKPTIPNFDSLATVARTGNYHDLANKVPTASKEFTGTVRAWVDEEGYLCVSNQELLLENGILILNNTGDTVTKQDAEVVIGG